MPEVPAALRSQRRVRRRWYAAIVVVIVAAVAATMAAVIGTGEAAHATLATSSASAPVPSGTIRSDPSSVWTTSDAAPAGNPLWVGTVVTYSDHQLSGRDATTGAVRWFYRRTDLSVCDAAQLNGRTFVLFRRNGNCDELSSFDTQTGDRGWFRTLTDNGEGRFQFGPTNPVIVYPASFHEFMPSDGYDVFNSAIQPGDCTIGSASAGTGGVLVAQRCGDGSHLALYSNTSGANSAPQVLWRVAVSDTTSAVAVDTAAAYTLDQGSLSRRQTSDGAIVSVPLPVTSGTPGPSLTNAPRTVVQIGTGLAALDRDGAVSWELGNVRGPAVPSDSTASSVFVATASGASVLDPSTGEVRSTYGFAIVDGARIYPAGGGLVVAGTTATGGPAATSGSAGATTPTGPAGLAYLR